MVLRIDEKPIVEFDQISQKLDEKNLLKIITKNIYLNELTISSEDSNRIHSQLDFDPTTTSKFDLGNTHIVSADKSTSTIAIVPKDNKNKVLIYSQEQPIATYEFDKDLSYISVTGDKLIVIQQGLIVFSIDLIKKTLLKQNLPLSTGEFFHNFRIINPYVLAASNKDFVYVLNTETRELSQFEIPKSSTTSSTQIGTVREMSIMNNYLIVINELGSIYYFYLFENLDYSLERKTLHNWIISLSGNATFCIATFCKQTTILNLKTARKLFQINHKTPPSFSEWVFGTQLWVCVSGKKIALWEKSILKRTFECEENPTTVKMGQYPYLFLAFGSKISILDLGSFTIKCSISLENFGEIEEIFTFSDRSLFLVRSKTGETKLLQFAKKRGSRESQKKIDQIMRSLGKTRRSNSNNRYSV